jgi:hypothetical protein
MLQVFLWWAGPPRRFGGPAHLAGRSARVCGEDERARNVIDKLTPLQCGAPFAAAARTRQERANSATEIKASTRGGPGCLNVNRGGGAACDGCTRRGGHTVIIKCVHIR